MGPIAVLRTSTFRNHDDPQGSGKTTSSGLGGKQTKGLIMNRIIILLACVVFPAAFLFGTAESAHAGVTPPPGPNFNCDGTFDGMTFRNVRIQAGATCIITNSTITGNVQGTGGNVVRIINTDVTGNGVNIRDVTGSVTIGSADCRVDPFVNNNLMVTGSNNVAICEMSIENNLVLSGNTGRMMARDNTVCNNIRVVDNDLVSLRVLTNVFTVNLEVGSNQVENRTFIEDNTQGFDGNPAQCRAAINP
jgi:hypothetical protein